MNQIDLPEQRNSLLGYAVSRLSPEIFFHPVWVRFGKKDAPGALNLIIDLLSTAKNLQNEEPGTACQVLLLCAVYQNQTGQYFNALKSTQQAAALARERSLPRESIWAIWGACAIAIQHGDYKQAAINLVDLQTALNEQREWVLANFIDEIKQFLFQPVQSQSGREYSSEDLLTITFDWLNHWGFSSQAFGSHPSEPSEDPALNVVTHSALTGSFFSIQRWQGRWHTLLLAFRGDLRMHWVKNDISVQRKRTSLWRSLLTSLRQSFRAQMTEPPVLENDTQNDNVLLLPAVNEPPLPKPKPRKPKSGSKHKKKSKASLKSVGDHIPLTVHMLGAFSVTIQDLTLKLPASRGLSIFKYLLVHHKQSLPREALMDVFWPDAEPETARNSLNVALHSLRRALGELTELSLILFADGGYRLAPNLQVWLDVEEFERAHIAGQRLEGRNQLTAAITEYEAAVSLYQGDFLEQNPYEEWTILDRERLRIAYLDTLDRLSQIYFEEERYSSCRTACQLILIKDACREDAHCLLMRCYSRQRQPHLALYQYQVCVEALRGELQVEPAPETTQLYNRIRRHEQV